MLLATALVATACIWLARAWMAGTFASAGRGQLLAWFGCAVALMLYTWWHIVTGRTTLTADGLHQTWVWDKRMDLRELAYGKLIRVPGLDWLIAPRLYVRTLMGKFAVFYACDAAMIEDFKRLVAELADFRRMQ